MQEYGRIRKGRGSNVHSYFEKNKTNRFSTQLGFDRIVSESSKLAVKNSISFYDRSIEVPDYLFSGDQLSTFSEINYSHKRRDVEWIGGLNLWTDRFSQKKQDANEAVDYNYITAGAFVQNTFNPAERR